MAGANRSLDIWSLEELNAVPSEKAQVVVQRGTREAPETPQRLEIGLLKGNPGRRGFPGYQGAFYLRLYIASSQKPEKLTTGTYDYLTHDLTLIPDGWTILIPNVSPGQRLWGIEVFINPENEQDNPIDLSNKWGEVFSASGESVLVHKIHSATQGIGVSSTGFRLGSTQEHIIQKDDKWYALLIETVRGVDIAFMPGRLWRQATSIIQHIPFYFTDLNIQRARRKRNALFIWTNSEGHVLSSWEKGASNIRWELFSIDYGYTDPDPQFFNDRLDPNIEGVHFGYIDKDEDIDDINFTINSVDFDIDGIAVKDWTVKNIEEGTLARLYWAVPIVDIQPNRFMQDRFDISNTIEASVRKTIDNLDYNIYLMKKVNAVDYRYNDTVISLSRV